MTVLRTRSKRAARILRRTPISKWLRAKRSLLHTYGPSHLPVPEPIDAAQALRETEAFWIEWSGRCSEDVDQKRDLVLRSLITLKALTFAPTGGIVAAPTDLMPEKLGGHQELGLSLLLAARRYLHAAGADELRLYRGSAGQASTGFLRAVAGSPALMQIMYGIWGPAAAPGMGGRLARRL
jgi:hypothetical protein